MNKKWLWILLVVPFLLAASYDQGGFSFVPKNKNHTGGTLTVPTTETDQTVWTPASGKKIVLMGLKFNSNSATQFLVETGSTAVIPTTDCTASGIMVITSSTPLWEGEADEALTYTTTNSSMHSVLMWGYEK